MLGFGVIGLMLGDVDGVRGDLLGVRVGDRVSTGLSIGGNVKKGLGVGGCGTGGNVQLPGCNEKEWTSYVNVRMFR